MKIKTISLVVFFGLAGCCSYKNMPRIVYYYNTNEMVECLYPGKDYYIYDYSSPFVGVADNEKHIPAHYQILLPRTKYIKRFYEREHNRCFVYTHNRGIAIIQELYDWRIEYENGLSEISKEEVEGWISKVKYVNNTKNRISVKDNRYHYLYVDNEMRIVMFNLSENDYRDFVELPLNSFKIKRHGEVRLDNPM